MQKKVALAPLCLRGRLLEVIQLEAIEPWAYTACLKKRGGGKSGANVVKKN